MILSVCMSVHLSGLAQYWLLADDDICQLEVRLYNNVAQVSLAMLWHSVIVEDVHRWLGVN